MKIFQNILASNYSSVSFFDNFVKMVIYDDSKAGNVFANLIMYNYITALQCETVLKRKMENIMQEFIKSSLDYIEQNLKTDITAEELAQMASYSIWHYCRLFNQTTGSSVASYILKRRLDCALAEISSGRKAVDVVFEYGFDTYAGFYKAFVKMYGCSPKKYLSIYKNNNDKSEIIIMQEQDLRNILKNWNIPADLKIEDVSEYDWKIWKVGEYYLRANERSKMIRNIKIAKALEKQGISSHFLPIRTKSGEDYIDGENIFILTQKIGVPLGSSIILDDKNRAKCSFSLGQSMAKIHQAFKEVQDDVKPDEVNLYKNVMEWAMPETKRYNQKYNTGISEEFFSDYAENFGKLCEKLPKQFIHRNPIEFSYENGEIVSVYGFEYYNEINVRLFDIIYCAGEVNTQPFEEYLENQKNILKGYDSINPLTHEEKQSIFDVTVSIGMIFIAYLDEASEAAERNREALGMIIENKEKFFDII